MSKQFFVLSSGDFSQDWGNTGLITSDNDWSNVPSIVGYRGDGVVGATGVAANTVTADASSPVNVIANQTNPNTLTTGGVAEFQPAASGSSLVNDPVVALQGSGTASAPNLVLYMDATGRQDLHLTADLRDIDGSADNSVQSVAVQYRIGDTGSWSNVPGGYTPDASTGPSQATLVTHLSLDIPAAAANASQVELRFLTTNAVGNDEWIGVDNIHVTSSPLAMADTTPPVLSGSTPADGASNVSQGANFVLSFNESVKAGSGAFTLTDGAGDTRTISVTDASQVSVSGSTVTINPTADLMAGDTYHLSAGAGVITDTSGNAYAGTGSNPIDFTTSNPAALTPIYAIQGAGQTSPLAGQQVTTSGVVTALDSNGFYLQDPRGDGNDATSDGVFVFTGSAPAVHVGDGVQLGATVQEHSTGSNTLTVTELEGVHDIVTTSTGDALPDTLIGAGGRLPPTEVVQDDPSTFDPAHDAIDFYESLEGMRVTITNAQAVDKTSGQSTWVVADGGAEATGVNSRGGITIAANDFNPEKIQLYVDTGVAPNLNLHYAQGDQLGNVTGVVSYYGGEYEVLPTSVGNPNGTSGPAPEATALAGDAAHLTLGAYNVETLDPSDTARVALIGQQIVGDLGSPDIMSLEEIEDADGAGSGSNLSGAATLNAVIASIKAAGGPSYAYVEIAPTTPNSTGGEPNGNIRNAFIYRTDQVSYVQGSARLINDPDPTNGDAFNNSRHPLAADFQFHGDTVTAISVHSYARSGSDELFGADQPPLNSGDQRRTDQSDAVHSYVQSLQAADPSAKIAVMGDFNGFYFERALTDLEQGNSLTNLVRTLAPNERFSYEFEGDAEQLDNLLVSPSLATGALFDTVHVNTGTTAATASDHDPILSSLLVNDAPIFGGPEGYTAASGNTLSVSAADGALSQARDPNGDGFTAALATGPSHGALTLNGDGSFVYNAAAGFTGADSFVVKAVDSFGASSAAETVTVNVVSGQGQFVYGSGLVQAQTTSGRDVLYGEPTTNNSFMFDAANLHDAHQIGGTAGVADFYGANENTPAAGTGHQDYLVLRGFSSSAQLVLEYREAGPGGGAYLAYDVIDKGQHHNFTLFSENGGALVQNYDYAFV